jgi:hypothetical protein
MMQRSLETRTATTILASLVVALAGAPETLAQPPMLPVGATLRYEVAVPGGGWGSSVAIQAGERVEWRVKVTYTGPDSLPVAGLGSITYQPILSNVDNLGTGGDQDQLGAWRNNGISGQGNTTLQQGLLLSAA